MASINIENDHYYFAPTGLRGSMKGITYQIELLELYALRALNNKWEYKIWTEDEAGHKFDDLLMSYKVGTENKLICLQAKHKETSSVFDSSTFFIDKNFHLAKYFESFIGIQGILEKNPDPVEIDNLVISTSNKFPAPNADGSLIISCSTQVNFELFFEKQTLHNNLYKEGVLYKFSPSKSAENCNLLKLYLLAVELTKFLFEKKSNNNIISPNNSNDGESDTFFVLPHAEDFLFLNILTCNQDIINFKDEFFDSEDPEIKLFRFFFKQELVNSKKIKMKYDRNSSEEFWRKIRARKFDDQDLIDKLNDFDSDDTKINDNIRKFTEKLLFVTDLSDLQTNQSIKIEILKIINDLSHLEAVDSRFTKKIKEWLYNSGPDNTHVKLNNLMMSQMFQNFTENNILKSSSLEFSIFPQDLKDFLKSQNNRVLIYEVEKGETLFGSIKLHQLNSKIIYYSTAKNNLNYDEVLAIMKTASPEDCLVVDCDNITDVNVLNDFMQKFQAESKAKVLIVCENTISGKVSRNNKIFKEDRMEGRLLTKNSLDKLLRNSVKFQGNEISLNELIDANCQSEIPLKEFMSFIERYVSSDSFRGDSQSPEIYLSRKIKRNVYLKEKLLEDWQANKFEEILVFSESEFNAKLPEAQKDGKSLHWVEKIEDQKRTKLIWRKSYFSIEVLRAYIDEKDFTAMKDEEFLLNISQYYVFKDIPGMGKSIFFQYLAQELKMKHRNHWVQKIDLRSYFNEFEDFQEKSIQKEDSKGIKNFFAEEFLKLKSSAVEKLIFSNLLSKGRVILLCDGFDELGEEHRNILLTIISSFGEISKENKFFISSRPECAQILEDKYFEFSYCFEEFSLEDQVDYLLKLWKKDSTFKDEAKLILEKVNSTITNQERSYTGIPLITKHVATYFEDKLGGKWETEKTNLSIYSLMKHDVDKKIEIFLTEKRDLKKDKFYKGQLRELHKKHQNLARKSFPESGKYFEHFKDFEQHEIDEFVGGGLFQNVNGNLIPYHQTVAETLFTTKLEENLKVPKVLTFLFEVALVKIRYQLIRSFVNKFIEKIQEFEDKVLLKSLIRDNIEVLNVAAKEKNSNTFLILFKILTENKEDSFDFFLKKNKDNYNYFYNFFRYCDVSESFLNDFGNKFDFESIKQILRLENCKYGQYKIMIAAAEHGRNYLPLTKWIIETFSNDFPFIEEMISTKEGILDENILYYSCENFHKESFISFLEVLKSLSDEFQVDFLSRLLVQNERYRVSFFDNLTENLSETNSECVNENFQVLIEICDWIRENTKVFEEFVLEGDILHAVAKYFNTYTLKFIKYLCQFENFNPEKILLCQNSDGETFFDFIFIRDRNNGLTELIKILNWVKQENVELLVKILEHEDNSGRNFIMHACENAQKNELPQILKTIYEFYQSNVSNFNDELFFMRKDENGETILDYIFRNRDVSVTIVSQIFDWIKTINFEIFQRLVNNSNSFINNLCEYSSRNDISSKLKTFIEYFEKSIPNFNRKDFLKKQKNKSGETFLHSFFEAHDTSETAKVSIEIFDYLKSIDVELLKEIILAKTDNGKTFVHTLCEEYRGKDLPNILKTIFDYLKSIDFQLLKEIIFATRKFGKTFVHTLCEDYHEKDLPNILKTIFDYLKSTDFQLLKEIILAKNDSGETFVHILCEEYREKDLPNILKTIFDYLKENLQEIDWKQFIKEKSYVGKTFLDLVRIYKCTDEEKLLIESEIIEYFKSVFEIDLNSDNLTSSSSSESFSSSNSSNFCIDELYKTTDSDLLSNGSDQSEKSSTASKH